MITVDEAIQQIRSHVPLLPSEEISIQDALGRVVSEDITAISPSPSFTNSAMDGFAVRWEDVQHTSEDTPAVLKIVGEAQAGIPFTNSLHSGEAVQISTGAMLPEGADTVVPVEECQIQGDTVKILKVSSKGKHVRLEGEEFKSGALIISRRTKLGPEQLALLASQGISKVRVFRKPGVLLFTTGTELQHFSTQNIQKHQIRDSNSIMLMALVREAGGEIIAHQHIVDDLNRTISTVKQMEEQADILLFTGGVSVGPHDHVRDAAKELGYQQVFWKIRQKPGKPFFFAVKNNKLWFGLPGNPVSAFMGFVHYIFPVVQYMSGGSFHWPTIEAYLQSDIKMKGNRIHFKRVKLYHSEKKILAEILQQQGSHMLTSVSDAHGYLVLSPEQVYEKHQKIKVYLYPWRTYEWIY